VRPSILLDTSFLISLANAAGNRKNHKVAKQYFEFAQSKSFCVYLSSLVVAEFTVRQAIDRSLRELCLPLSFSIMDGVRAGEFRRVLDHASKSVSPGARESLAVDLMLISQAHNADMAVILTEDEDTMAKYAARLRELNVTNVHTVLLKNGYDPMAIAEPGNTSMALPQASED
jgi:predicted nucleic acid-binding protein